MGNRKRTSEMTDEEFMREFNLYKKEQIKNGSKRTGAQMERDFVAEWDRKAKAEAATLPQNRRTKAEWDKINAERMSKGKRPTVVYTKQKEETNQQTEIPEEYKGRFEGKKTRMSIPPISKEGFLNQFSKAQAERDKDEESKPSEQQLTKHKNDYSDVDPTWPRVNIIDEKGNKVEVPDYTKEAAQYVNAIFDNEDDRAKLRKAGVEAVDEILSKSTSGAGSDRTNAPVSVNIKPEEEDPETISIQQSNISTSPSSTPVSSDTVKSVIPETKTTASTPQQTTQPFQTTTKKDRTEGGAEYVDNTDKTTGDVGSPSSTARPNVDNANQYNDMAKKNNQNNPNVDEVEKVSENGKNAVDEAGKVDGKKLSVNTQSEGRSATVQQGASESKSDSRSTARKEVDRDALPGSIEAANEVYRQSPTAVEELMPWIRDDLDPKKAEAKKRDANFRKGLHEAVESLRVLSDIGASFAGGNAYRRNAPDYKRYEEEKAKVDEARNRALDMLFKAQAADRDYKRNLMSLAYGNSFKSETEQATEGSQRSASSTVGAQSQEGHQPKGGGNTIIKNGDGGGIKNGHSITITSPNSGTATTYTLKNEDSRKKFMHDRFGAIENERVSVKSTGNGGWDVGDNYVSKAFGFWLNRTESGKAIKEKGFKDSNGNFDRAKFDEAVRIFKSIALNGTADDKKCYGDQEAISRFIEDFEPVQRITMSLVNGGEVDLSSSGPATTTKNKGAFREEY